MAVQQLPIPGPVSSASKQAIAGIVAIGAGTAAYAGQDILMKDLLDRHSLWLLVVVRLAITVVLLSGTIVFIGGRHRFVSSHFKLHALRGFLMSISFAAFYTALPSMTLAAAATISYSFPFFVTVLAIAFFGERIGWRRVAALLTGFSGVIVTMRPGSELFDPISLLPLFGAFAYAVVLVLLRRVGDSESSVTVALHSATWFGIFTLLNGYILTLVVGPIDGFSHLDWRWTMPPATEFLTIAVLGVCGFIGLTMSSRAYQIAPASFIAPFDYAYLGWAALFGFVFFGTVPSGYTLIGMGLIVGAGLYVGRRELMQLRRLEAEARAAERVREIV